MQAENILIAAWFLTIKDSPFLMILPYTIPALIRKRFMQLTAEDRCGWQRVICENKSILEK